MLWSHFGHESLNIVYFGRGANMRELELVEDYYLKSKPAFEATDEDIYKEVDKIFSSFNI